MLVLPVDVLTWLGITPAGPGQDLDQIEAHLVTATAMVKAYTRDGGFDTVTGEPADDIAAVIISCAARSYRNPSVDRTQTVGPFQTTPGTFGGWTLPELAVLHRYRVRAQ
ncbi:hypothetical protein FNH13_08320 [Ornithinimicrobium ciconiae]|uniref:Phage gp6-like head-tail connector protein n=1 Tax=Ornithinimicrobium ciconiae TaxID=2594265 RepID=A0A516G9Z7_9MICO|nr:hypothetical protein [Ornithinimicrobium ciconiae]QDO88346.1 hypothetical protein FNH13_08320 [Ornithinimicrobium ciconiae]